VAYYGESLLLAELDGKVVENDTVSPCEWTLAERASRSFRA
jgi:hypothetical protein